MLHLLFLLSIDILQCNTTTERASFARLDDVYRSMCSNATFISFKMEDKGRDAFLHTGDFNNAEAAANMTFVDSDFSNSRRCVIGGSIQLNISLAFVNCTLQRLVEPTGRSELLACVSFVDCVLNVTELTGKTANGRNGIIGSARRIVFRNCTFVGGIANERCSFIYIRENNSDSIEFADCFFDLPEAGGDNKRHFMVLEDCSSMNITFTRCIAAPGGGRPHIRIAFRGKEIASKSELAASGILVEDNCNGLNVTASVVGRSSEIYESADSFAVVEDVGYGRETPSYTPFPSFTMPPATAGTPLEKSIPYNIISIALAACLVIVVVVLIIVCVKKKKKYNRSE